jgi:hypothetical protein
VNLHCKRWRLDLEQSVVIFYPVNRTHLTCHISMIAADLLFVSLSSLSPKPTPKNPTERKTQNPGSPCQGALQGTFFFLFLFVL